MRCRGGRFEVVVAVEIAQLSAPSARQRGGGKQTVVAAKKAISVATVIAVAMNAGIILVVFVVRPTCFAAVAAIDATDR